MTIYDNNKNNTPFLFNFSIDKSKPKGYETSDLKIFTCQDINYSRMITPVLTQEQLLKM